MDDPSASRPEPTPEQDFERKLVSDLLSAAVTERRRARRWGIFFKSLLAVYLVILLVLSQFNGQLPTSLSGAEHTALIDIEGVIGSDPEASADNVVKGLREALENARTKGVILRINSPGGSPVHAGYINNEVYRLRAKYPDIPVYAVITDVCASGGYYIAVAANRIFADKASLVGSIGVAMRSFGFVGTLDRLGIERRLWTAGEHKDFLDPFSPAKPEDVDHLKGVLSQVHRQFVEVVKKGRGERLKDDPSLYSGLVWTGEEGVALGLVDALGSSGYVAREVIGAEEIVDFTHEVPFLERLSDGIGEAVAKVLARSVPLIQ
ncbi:MAG: S49 family peptidase [Gammaproteobacteria bacterium]